jgi:outer membrane lipopolysaccharide assembly protein LptE/RlpB
MSRVRIRRCAALAALLMPIFSGCGFRLQGSTSVPHSIPVVRIETSDTESDFYFGLRKALLADGIRIDEDGHDDTAAVVEVLTDSTNERVLSV